MKTHFFFLLILLLLPCSFCVTFIQATTPESLDISLQTDIEEPTCNGIKFLLSKQESDGSWAHHPAITGLVLSCLLRANLPSELVSLAITKGFSFLKTCAKEDGSIYLFSHKNYSTSIALRAFKDAHNHEYGRIIENAENYLMSIQFNENNGYPSDSSLYYGGVGFGYLDTNKRPDLSNLQWAINGLYDNIKKDPEKLTKKEKQHYEKKALFYSRALQFLAKCQNLKSVNPMDYAANDGGFMYGAGMSKAESTNSYGSMTYAGILSMIYANVDTSDPRVIAAVEWISKNFTVKYNPGLLKGQDGLYYYYHTMAKALNAAKIEIIQTPSGEKFYWRTELAKQLLALQKPVGYWVNETSDRWMESNEILVTSYTILTIEELTNGKLNFQRDPTLCK